MSLSIVRSVGYPVLALVSLAVALGVFMPQTVLGQMDRPGSRYPEEGFELGKRQPGGREPREQAPGRDAFGD
jgi:hypothetical protein